MTAEEKIRELAEIIDLIIPVIQSIAPHRFQDCLEYLRERAEELADP